MSGLRFSRCCNLSLSIILQPLSGTQRTLSIDALSLVVCHSKCLRLAWRLWCYSNSLSDLIVTLIWRSLPIERPKTLLSLDIVRLYLRPQSWNPIRSMGFDYLFRAWKWKQSWGAPGRGRDSFGVLVISVVGMVMVMMIVIPGQTMAITLSMVVYNREDNDG